MLAKLIALSSSLVLIFLILGLFSCKPVSLKPVQILPIDSITINGFPEGYYLFYYGKNSDSLALISMDSLDIYVYNSTSNSFDEINANLSPKVIPKNSNEMRFSVLKASSNMIVLAMNDTVYFYNLKDETHKKILIPRKKLEYYNGLSVPRLCDSVSYFTVYTFQDSSNLPNLDAPLIKKVIITEEGIDTIDQAIYYPYANFDGNYGNVHIQTYTENSNAYYYSFRNEDTIHYMLDGEQNKYFIIPAKYSVKVNKYDPSDERTKNRMITDPELIEFLVNNANVLARIKLRSDSISADGLYITYQDVPQVYVLFDKNSGKVIKEFTIPENQKIVMTIGNKFFAMDKEKRYSADKLYIYELP